MLLSAKNLLGQSWKIYEKRFKVFLGIMAVPVAVSFLLAFVMTLGIGLTVSNSAFIIGLGFAILTLSAVLTIGGIIIQLWSQTALLYSIKDREENIGIKESYRRGWSIIISYFWISFLSGLIITGGFFLFFVPGLIFLVWFSLSAFVLVSEGRKGWSALAASREYVRGNWWPVFWRFLFIGVLSWLVLFALNFLISFAVVSANDRIYFYIGYVFLTPVVTVYSFLIYENLRKVKTTGSAVSNTEPKK